MREFFRKFSSRVSLIVGSPWTFFFAVGAVVGWALTGPFFGFSDTWQLVINTGTTIITFLVVFLIQNTQNRDAQLIRAVRGARNGLVDLEDLSDDELERLQKEFREFHEQNAARGDALSEESGRRRRAKGTA